MCEFVCKTICVQKGVMLVAGENCSWSSKSVIPIVSRLHLFNDASRHSKPIAETSIQLKAGLIQLLS